jgi:hypothetical protein
MRVSSLSDERVIRLVSRHFVPAWISRDHYQQGPWSAEEQAELLRLDRQRASNKMPGGNVSVIIIDAEGDVIASRPVGQTSDPEKLLPWLRAVIEVYKIPVRSPEASRATAATAPPPPKPKEGGRNFSIWTRFDDSGRGRGTSHDRVELSAREWSAFVPREPVRVGDSWTVPAEVSQKLLRYGYPPLPHWDSSQGKVRAASLTLTVVAVDERQVRLRVEGNLELIYPFKGEPTDAVATAQLVGTARVDLTQRKLTEFQLTSEKAGYLWYWEGKPQPRTMVLAVQME